jgi:molybdenum cofactor cytidylyltransferase
VERAHAAGGGARQRLRREHRGGGAFIFLGDMPRVPHAVLAPMTKAVLEGAPAAAPVFEGRRGNPVLLGRELFPQLLALTGDAGARAVLEALGDRLALIAAPDDGVLFDIDERRDLKT